MLVVAGLVLGTWACGAATELERQGLDDEDASPPEAAPPFDGPFREGGYEAGEGGGYEDVYEYESGFEDSPYPGDTSPPHDGYSPPYDVYTPPYDGYYPPPFDGYYPPPYDGYYPPYDGYYPPFDGYYPPPYDTGYEAYPPPDDVYPPPFDVGAPDSGPPWDGGLPVAIATHEDPVALALDDTYVYWVNSGGTVLDCPVAGCPSNVPTILALDAEGYGSQTLAAGDLTAFFVDTSYNIDTCAGAGCGLAATKYESGEVEGGLYYYFYDSLITDSANTYFTEGSTIYSCPLGATCSAPVSLHTVTKSSVGLLAVSSANLFFVREGYSADSIRSVPIGGGSSTLVCDSSTLADAESMVYAGGYVYFTSGYTPGTIYQCLAAGGGSPTVYATDTQPYGLATDGTNLYWTNYAGSASVATCAVGATCTSPRTVASGQDYPTSIAVNAASVFWITETDIYAAAK